MRANLPAISRELTNNVFMAKVRRRGKKLGVNLFNRARHGYVSPTSPSGGEDRHSRGLADWFALKSSVGQLRVGPHRRWMKGEFLKFLVKIVGLLVKICQR